MNIDKALYDKVAYWLADFDVGSCQGSIRGNADMQLLLQDAQQILYEVYQAYVEKLEKDNAQFEDYQEEQSQRIKEDRV